MQKVIIWGYPLHSHTHSYIHYGWHKAFKHLGYETYWFHDKDYPKDFDYTNCLFITEGYADDQIPLHESNVYCVHIARYPLKYIGIGARLIDIRYNVLQIKDFNYIYSQSNKTLVSISDVTQYEPDSSDRDLHPKYQNTLPLIYEAVYMCWATDLLPHEINLEDRFKEPIQPPVLHYLGTVGGGNQKEVQKLITGCERKGIKFLSNDPWKNPISFEDAKLLVQQSCIAPDVRGSGDPSKLNETGTHHKQNGYIPCRLFKNISYGKLGASNCKRLYDLFGDHIIFCENEEQLVNLCLEKEKDKDYIEKQMIWVRDNHTYVNRIQDLMKILDRTF